jgi:hypothetical protein
MGFTDSCVNNWLSDIVDSGWISLHYDSPALDGAGLSEISGGGYTRMKGSFSEPANRTIWLLFDISWSGLSQTKVTHFGIWSAATGGTLQAYGAMSEPRIIMSGHGYIIRQQELSLSIA